MPTLPSLKFQFKSEAGEPLEFTSAVSVSAAGVFAVTIPRDLETIAKVVLREAGAELPKARLEATDRNVRIYAPALDTCRKVIGLAGARYVQCETTMEKVILYGHRMQVAYALDPADNTLHPNGYTNSGERLWRGGLDATHRSSFFQVGFAARVMDKTTYNRGGVTKAEFKPSPTTCHHTQPQSYHDKLNSLVGLNIDLAACQEVPYTEEAAKFFYGIMIGLCSLAERITEFFASEDQLQLAIRSQGNPLLPNLETK